jgi:sugar (pentulose or hexulose) kinase
VTEEGDILNSTGTVEVMVLCTSRPRASQRYLIRNHALPGKWLIMNILSTGGEAVEWVRRQFYREMEEREFFEEHLPRTLAAGPTPVRMGPYLCATAPAFGSAGLPTAGSPWAAPGTTSCRPPARQSCGRCTGASATMRRAGA